MIVECRGGERRGEEGRGGERRGEEGRGGERRGEEGRGGERRGEYLARRYEVQTYLNDPRAS